MEEGGGRIKERGSPLRAGVLPAAFIQSSNAASWRVVGEANRELCCGNAAGLIDGDCLTTLHGGVGRSLDFSEAFVLVRLRTEIYKIMKTLQIDGIQYNLAHLVSVEYKQTPQDQHRKGTGLDAGHTFLTGEVKFTSVLKIVFMNCDPIVFHDAEADAAWKTVLDVIKPSPVAELSTRISPKEPTK